MRILLDCDNVICDTTRSVLDVHYEKTGERLSVDDIKTYYIENFVSPEYKDDFYTIFLDKRVWKGIQVLPHCVEVVERLHNAGHEIWIATSTEAANVHKKARFLQRTFPFLNIRKRLITTPYKQILNADLLIDDCVDNVINAQYKSILMTYPWNANFDDASDENIYRVNNWLEVEPMIEYIEKVNYIKENKMSYDINLLDPVTHEVIQFDTPHQIKGGMYCMGGTTEAWINITYNYGQIYREKFGKEGIRTIYGMTGAESIPIIQKVIDSLSNETNSDYWTATEGNAKRALYGLLSFAKMRPDGIWDGD